MGRIYFTKEIIADPVKLTHQLNLLSRSRGTSKTVKAVQTQVQQLSQSVTNLMTPPAEVLSAGPGISIGFSRAVTGAGVESFAMADIGTSAYVIDGFMINAAGDKVTVVPEIPPLTDSRIGTGFNIRYYETGTIYVWLTVIDDVIGMTKTIAGAGVETLTFTARSSVNYMVDGFVFTASGDKGLIVPQIPPLTDSRTLTSVDIRVFEAGTLYACLTPY